MSTNLTRVIEGRPTAALWRSMMMAFAILAAAMILVKPAAARGAPESFADLVEKLSPAVVNISTVQTIRERRGRPQLPEGLPFGDLWDQFRDQGDEDPEPRQARSLGSGFIVDPSGIVITNNHVVEEADEITVIKEDGSEYTAKLLGRDALSDVAVLKIEPKSGEKLPFVPWGDSDKERIGDWVVAIGNPFGLGGSVTAGIISARNRTINTGDIEFIQTDAPINRGNSGGPLFNMKGEVIGVNSAIFSPSGGNVGIGFSIPSNDASRVMVELQQFGKVRRGWLGVGIQPMTEEISESLGMEFHKGAMITNVQDESPAAKAGLKQGDIIVTWDAKPVEDSASLSRLVKRTEIGKPVVVELIREGKPQKVNVTTGELKGEDLAQAEGREGGDQGGQDRDDERADRELVQGMELAPMTDNLRRRYNLDEEVEGVVVLRVARRSPVYQAGIRPGTVILRVNQHEVGQPSDVADLIDEARDESRERVLLLVNYRGNTVHVPVRLMNQEEEDKLRR